MMQTTTTIHQNAKIGNYVLKCKVGEGAFAEVWKAVHCDNAKRVVAIKLATNPAYRRNLRKEGLFPQLKHPNIVPILDSDTRFADVPYVVMPFYPRGDVSRLLAKYPNGLPEKTAGQILLNVLAGLAEAHARGIVHRDVKPANVLIDDRGNALLADFGCSLGAVLASTTKSIKQSLSAATDENAWGGTLVYMAPEVIEGYRPTPAADVYSVGVMLFEFLTGRRPVGIEMPSQVRRDLKHAVKWDAVYYRACRPPTERYVDAASMWHELRRGPKSTDVPTAVRPPASASSGQANGRNVAVPRVKSSAATASPSFRPTKPTRPSSHLNPTPVPKLQSPLFTPVPSPVPPARSSNNSVPQAVLFVLGATAIIGVVVGLAAGIIGWTLGLFNGGWLAGGIVGAIVAAVFVGKIWGGGAVDEEPVIVAGFIGAGFGAFISVFEGSFDTFFVIGAIVGIIGGAIVSVIMVRGDERIKR